MTELDRRQFLARTALGSAGVVAASALGPLAAEAVGSTSDVAPGARDPYFAEGKVLSIDGAILVVSSSDFLLQRLQVTAGTGVWKLRETTLEDVRVDDRLYARGVPSEDGTFLAERIWVNIVNLHVAFAGIRPDRLQLDHPGGRLVGHVVPETVVVYALGPPTRDLSRLRVGMHAQVVGAWHPDTDEIDVATIYA
jgi:hypothetical protein